MEEVNKEVVETKQLNFLEEIIEADLASGKHESIMTRFPPEPNGYLHIGHAKSICINFGLAKKYGGKTNLRFDDTNPVKEDTEYVDSIKEDIKWLGFEWERLAMPEMTLPRTLWESMRPSPVMTRSAPSNRESKFTVSSTASIPDFS